jgi:hypothetical protein
LKSTKMARICQESRMEFKAPGKLTEDQNYVKHVERPLAGPQVVVAVVQVEQEAPVERPALESWVSMSQIAHMMAYRQQECRRSDAPAKNPPSTRVSTLGPIKSPSLGGEHEVANDEEENAKDHNLHDEANPEDKRGHGNDVRLLRCREIVLAETRDEDPDANDLNQEREEVPDDEDRGNPSSWDADVARSELPVGRHPIYDASKGHIACRSDKGWRNAFWFESVQEIGFRVKALLRDEEIRHGNRSFIARAVDGKDTGPGAWYFHFAAKS